ncbi:MAG: amidase [bacterium]
MSSPPSYLFWSATHLANAIRQGQLTSREVVEASLARVEEINPVINAAVQVVSDRALSEAEQLDQLACAGRFQGPLHGVPISIKDSLDTEGIVTTGGTLGRKNFVPHRDAPVVKRLRDAGAVLIAKTNTPELTLGGETENLIYGRTNNPYDIMRSPGGSSGGSAAMVAVGGAALELGSDTGGSIREPAHLCGVAGIKPTTGRTPRTGHIVPYGTGVLDSLTQIGPIARYVEDLELGLRIICGPDGQDPGVVPVPLLNSETVELSNIRIAYYTDNGVVPLDSEVERVVEQAVATLKPEVLSIEHAPMPGMPRMTELLSELRRAATGAAASRLLERYGTVQPGPDLERYFKKSDLSINATVKTSLLESIDEQRSQALMFMQNFDAIICPPSHVLARLHGQAAEDSYEHWSYITLQNLLGWPGSVVRAGTSADGILPIGVQIVAAPWREDITLALAKRIETLLGGYRQPEI